ncbi:5'/3'-nucleotidase SurE [Planctomycetia bacterium]|nr:5'/3'-nucleotidase SurE [Planctomycetia bacterium]
MRILLTNDDGIDAPGLEALAVAAARLGRACVVVAPVDPHSGCGHRVTTDRPLRVIPAGPGRFAVTGTPADCVRIALAELAPDATLVLSGINAGGNLGADIHHSGTVAAAREAALHGRIAVAASHYRRSGGDIDWERAATWLELVFSTLPLGGEAPAAGSLWNVNLPDPPEGMGPPPIVECPVDASPFALGYRMTDEGWRYAANYHERPRMAQGDVALCFGGAITVSRLGLV